ncbi:unnamed protein product [Somion occarium]|uniref:NAD(P)-binding protein n=1 Tax=Somion occarium TaxID=3059160 RepID=A0ABP1D6R1_9APHY
MSIPRIWFITGTSSGFGRLMTENALGHGDIVVATARKPEALDDLKSQYPSSKLLVLPLDVTNNRQIKDVFSKAKEAFGRIDVVFNIAGRGILGEAEGTPEDEARALFDTNFWGATNVSREAVRFFREENKPAGGRLLVNSSKVGIQAVPFAGYYSATKHALEGITKALAQELDPAWNIKVTLVQPGFFRTDVGAKSVVFPIHPAYTNPTLPGTIFRAFLASGKEIGSDTAQGVEKIYELACLSEPPMRLALGIDAIRDIRAELKGVEADVGKYESWSEGLVLDT